MRIHTYMIKRPMIRLMTYNYMSRLAFLRLVIATQSLWVDKTPCANEAIRAERMALGEEVWYVFANLKLWTACSRLHQR